MRTGFGLRVFAKAQAPEPFTPAEVARRVANNREEPCAKRRGAAKPSLALEYLQIRRLQHCLGVGWMARAAGQGPAVSLGVMCFELFSQLAVVHQIRLPDGWKTLPSLRHTKD